MKKNKTEIDIYKELSKIEVSTISKCGKDIQKLLNNRSIKGFLKQKILQKKLDAKLEQQNLAYFKKVTKPTNNVGDELDKLCQKNNITAFQKEKNLEIEGICKDYEEMMKKKKENDKKYSINNKLTRKECLDHFLQLKKRFQIQKDVLSYLQEQKKKIPTILKYNPNYNSIFPHVPLVKLQKDMVKKTHILKKNNFSITTNIDSSDPTEIDNTSQNLLHVMSFEKYSPRKNFIVGQPLSDSTNKPDKIVRNISAPNFSKMCAREKKKKTDTRLPGIIDYSPNYEAILPNSQRKTKKNSQLEGKKKMIKKLWTSFNIPKEYVVITKLNEHNF